MPVASPWTTRDIASCCMSAAGGGQHEQCGAHANEDVGAKAGRFAGSLALQADDSARQHCGYQTHDDP